MCVCVSMCSCARMCDLTTPHRFGSVAFRLLRNTEIKGITGKFAYPSLLIRRREARETKTRGNCKVKELGDGCATMKSTN